MQPERAAVPSSGQPAAARTQREVAPGRTGLERECLRQAIHDVRGPLNTATVLLDLVTVLASRDPALAATKAGMVVRELHSLARMLHNLVGTGDSLASELVPVDLAAAVADAVARSPAASAGRVAVSHEGLRESMWVESCPVRLARALDLLLEKCAASLPDGGTIHVEAADADGRARLAIALRGPRVIALPDGRPHLTGGTEPTETWFALFALARGVGGELAFGRGDVAAASLTLDLPRAAATNS